MSVVLDSPRAELLVRGAVEKCGNDALVASVVTHPGGKSLAEKHNVGTGQMARTFMVRDLNLLAAQGREDIGEVPTDWSRRQATAVIPAPALTGAALRIYARSGTPDAPSYQLVGVIGLLGIEAERAVAILTEVVSSNGFFLHSDLPQAGAQG